MAEFLGDLAFMFEILVLGIGLIVIYFAQKERSKLLKASGWIMSVAATFGLICTTYFYMKYYFAGEFDHAYANHKFTMQHLESGNLPTVHDDMEVGGEPPDSHH